MTQDLKGAATPPNMAKQVWPFCPRCGEHKKSAEFRYRLRAVACDPCYAKRRRPRPWHTS